MLKKLCGIAFVSCVCFLCSGCALLNVPFQMLGMVSGLLGQAMNLLGQLPIPPATALMFL